MRLVANDLGPGMNEALEGLDGPLGFLFSDVADDGIEADHTHDDDGVRDPSGENGDSRGNAQQGYGKGIELTEKDAEPGA